jgi:hypothetical protein
MTEMKAQTYYKEFDDKDEAEDWMRMKNAACRRAGNKRDVYVLVDGPDDNFVVMDLRTAVESGFLYTWS